MERCLQASALALPHCRPTAHGRLRLTRPAPSRPLFAVAGRPPLVSVLVLGPDHMPVVQPPTPGAESLASQERQPELKGHAAQLTD